MQQEVDLYDGHYGYIAADPQVAVRRETYDVDLGQASWITLDEAREFFRALELGPGQTALEVACGSTPYSATTRSITCPSAPRGCVTGTACCGRGGRLLFTDPILVTGQLSNEEMRDRKATFIPLGPAWPLVRGPVILQPPGRAPSAS